MSLKHDYKINGNTAQVFVDSERFFTIDTEDVPKVLAYRWHITKDGYVKNSSVGYLHRFILDAPRNKITDHISHNTLNNTKANLHLCDYSENSFNRLLAMPSSHTGERGITFNKKTLKYEAKCRFRGETIKVGSFDKLEEAEEAILKIRQSLYKYSDENALSPNMELRKEKETKLALQRISRIKLPRFSIFDENIKYSPFDYQTNKCFKAYLHYPIKTEYKDKKVKFCITYRLLTFKDKIKTITFFYNDNNSVIGACRSRKQTNAINLLNKISNIIIKELSIYEQVVSTPRYISKSDNNWVYGVPINEDFFRQVSLGGEKKDIIKVGYAKNDFIPLSEKQLLN